MTIVLAAALSLVFLPLGLLARLAWPPLGVAAATGLTLLLVLAVLRRRPGRSADFPDADSAVAAPDIVRAAATTPRTHGRRLWLGCSPHAMCLRP
ncbi:hypothetical protein [Streptomyces aquilus]|uniref:hypothetical protein n=1 Tax=Streptomyces aquilus TaxID=2548456 RepID=UPI0036B0278F